MAEGGRLRSPTPPPHLELRQRYRTPSSSPEPFYEPIFPLIVDPQFHASVPDKIRNARAVYRLRPFLDMELYFFDDYVYFRSKSTKLHHWLLHWRQYNFIMKKYAEVDKAIDDCIHKKFGESLILESKWDYDTGKCFVTLEVTEHLEFKYHVYCPAPDSGVRVGYRGHGVSLTRQEFYDWVRLMPAIHMTNYKFDCPHDVWVDYWKSATAPVPHQYLPTNWDQDDDDDEDQWWA